MSRTPPGAVGDRAESVAATYLESRGLELIDRNYRCRRGEIDLVARDSDTLVFVEVRYRRHARNASPAESITPAKQRRIRFAAEHFLQQRTGLAYRYCRFDVVSILGTAPRLEIDWLRHAFE